MPKSPKSAQIGRKKEQRRSLRAANHVRVLSRVGATSDASRRRRVNLSAVSSPSDAKAGHQEFVSPATPFLPKQRKVKIRKEPRQTEQIIKETYIYIILYI